MWAAAFGRVNCITILIEAGADKEAKSRPRPDSPSTYSWTALMVAVDNGHNEGVEALLDQGAIARLDGYPNIEAKDEDGCTPLARAARNGWSRTVRLLLDSGADVNAMSKVSLFHKMICLSYLTALFFSLPRMETLLSSSPQERIMSPASNFLWMRVQAEWVAASATIDLIGGEKLTLSCKESLQNTKSHQT